MGQYPLADLNALLDAIEHDLNRVTNDQERMTLGNEINGRLRRAKKTFDALSDERIEAVMRATSERLRYLTRRVLVEVFSFTPTEAEAVDIVLVTPRGDTHSKLAFEANERVEYTRPDEPER